MMNKLESWGMKILERSPYMKEKINKSLTLTEIFIDQSYKWLCQDLIPGTTAIDIGANIGDSTIYLAMQKEITHIKAFEPFPNLYNQAVDNIAKAGYGDKVDLHNEGVDKEESILDVPKSYRANIYSSTGGFKRLHYAEGRGIRMVKLDDILNKINSKHIIIKCDCEGAEHQIFNGKNNLKDVYRIQIEYHNGLRDLQKNLEAQGFKCTTKGIKADKALGQCGWVYAWKDGE
jgi:FkbM family methyltransferase